MYTFAHVYSYCKEINIPKFQTGMPIWSNYSYIAAGLFVCSCFEKKGKYKHEQYPNIWHTTENQLQNDSIN